MIKVQEMTQADEEPEINMSEKIELRDYQLQAMLNIKGLYNEGHRAVLYCLATGGGKTVVFSEIIRRVGEQGKISTVFVHRRNLLEQTKRYLNSINAKNVFVETVQDKSSIKRALDSDFIVIDEAHHSPARTWLKLLDKCHSRVKILGCTATPFRSDRLALDVLFQAMIYGPSIAQLIRAGYLSPVDIWSPEDNDPCEDPIVAYKTRQPNTTAIAFTKTVRGAKELAEKFCQAGVAAEHINGSMPKREQEEILTRLKTKEIKILCSCDLISEGFDAPNLDGVILLRDTKSKGLFMQQIGRVLRPARGKIVGYIHDHAGNTRIHGDPLDFVTNTDAGDDWDFNHRLQIPLRQQIAASEGGGARTELELTSAKKLVPWKHSEAVAQALAAARHFRDVGGNWIDSMAFAIRDVNQNTIPDYVLSEGRYPILGRIAEVVHTARQQEELQNESNA